MLNIPVNPAYDSILDLGDKTRVGASSFSMFSETRGYGSYGRFHLSALVCPRRRFYLFMKPRGSLDHLLLVPQVNVPLLLSVRFIIYKRLRLTLSENVFSVPLQVLPA